MNPNERRMFEFLAELEDNIADEAAARRKYYNLLADFGEFLSPHEKELIEELISEELKHSEVLAQIIYRRNRIAAEE